MNIVSILIIMTIVNVTNTLRVRRAMRGVNQFDVAAAISCSRDRYWRIEKGYVVPTDAEREALCAYFGTTEDVIWPDLMQSA